MTLIRLNLSICGNGHYLILMEIRYHVYNQDFMKNVIIKLILIIIVPLI